MSTKTFSVPLRTVVSSVNAMNELMVLPMPAKTSFNVGKIASQINKTIEDVQATSRKRSAEMREELGLEDNIDSESVSGDELEEYSRKIEQVEMGLKKEMDELLDSTDIEFDGDRVSISDLGHAQIKPQTLLALEWLVVG